MNKIGYIKDTKKLYFKAFALSPVRQSSEGENWRCKDRRHTRGAGWGAGPGRWCSGGGERVSGRIGYNRGSLSAGEKAGKRRLRVGARTTDLVYFILICFAFLFFFFPLFFPPLNGCCCCIILFISLICNFFPFSSLLLLLWHHSFYMDVFR